MDFFIILYYLFRLLLLKPFNCSQYIRVAQGQDFGRQQGSIGRLQHDRRSDPRGHAQGRVNIRAAKRFAGRRAGDHRGGDRAIGKTRERIAAPGDRDVNLWARIRFVGLQKIEGMPRGLVGEPIRSSASRPKDCAASAIFWQWVRSAWSPSRSRPGCWSYEDPCLA